MFSSALRWSQSDLYITLIKHHATKPISASSGKFLVGLLPRECYLINIPILRSKQVMFWALQLRTLLILMLWFNAQRVKQRTNSCIEWHKRTR